MEGYTIKCGYTMKCGGHNYVTLEHEGRFIFSLDNDSMYAEEIIYQIEKRTRQRFADIPIKGTKEDFQGLRFFKGGWKRDFWGEFPSDGEIASYMKLKKGQVTA